MDIYDGTALIASVSANQFRQDLLNAGIGNGSHGFTFSVPASLKDGQTHSIRARFGGTTVDVGNSPTTITCSASTFFQGYIDSVNGQAIGGWAWDRNQPNTTINVDIYDGAALIATVPANQFRRDLLNAGIGNGSHGFSFSVPASLKDGQTHSIRARFGGTTVDVGNSPTAISCSAATFFQGYIDSVNCQAIGGWAWDRNQPNTTINVDIYDGTILIATVPANRFRQDLLNAGIGNGSHGYSFTIPASLKDGRPHSIRARYGATTLDVGNSPTTITCAGP